WSPRGVPPPADTAVPVEQLQFRQVELAGAAPSRRCVACKSPIPGEWFQAAGQDICPNCAQRIRSGQQAPPVHSLLRAALYGGGAALAGCAIYAAVAIIANLELALIAILIGWMVGRAVRHGSNGLGGRPQQILAVLLTYFAITFSYVVVFVHSAATKPHAAQQQTAEAKPQRADSKEPMGLGGAVVALVSLAAIAPFLELGSNVGSGLLSLVIIFFGLQRAWRMTGRSNILIMGPYTETS